MSLYQNAFMVLGAFILLSSFQFEKTNGIRLCGRRLADLLNFICEKHGGFHTPRLRRDGSSKTTSKRALIEIFKPVTRRSNSDSTDEDATGSSNEVGVNFGFQSGIVDECCKKQCKLSTIVSYCANVEQAGSIDLTEILPPENESFPSLSEEHMTTYQLQQAPAVHADEMSRGTIGQTVHLPSHLSYSSRPNLGHSSRNRPIFIVLSQLQEDDDRALGEYRF